MKTGDQILGYTVDEKIGEGGFGTVYKVSKTDVSGTDVRALKHITIPNRKQYADVLNSMGGDYAKADDYFASVLKDVVNEIQIIRQLSEDGSVNVVRYYDRQIDETKSPKKYDIYILMEYLTPLTDYLYEKQMTVGNVVKLGEDILSALKSCHEQGVIHRDIKEDNIFVTKNGTFKLGDFGVSKMIRDKSRAESMKGTPNYIAPEVYLHKGAYDDTVDVYSMGIVLYKLLNHSRIPFLPKYPATYNSNDEDSAFEKRMNGEIPLLPSEAENVLGDAIIKAISPREQRYDSAEEFLQAIDKAAAQLLPDDMDKVLNQDVADTVQKTFGNQTTAAAGKTIGADLAPMVSGAGNKPDSDEKDLFRTVSDTYDPVPVRKPTPPPENKPKEKPHIAGSNVGKAVNRQSDASGGWTGRTQRTEPVQKADFTWVAYLCPILIAAIYVIIYVIVMPMAYGKGLTIGRLMTDDPESIAAFLMDKNKVFAAVNRILLLKILMYVLYVAFIASLFALGYVIQNKKPKQHIDAIMHDREAYVKAMAINARVQNITLDGTDEAKTAVRNVTEHLRNESAFGYGNIQVIRCENEVAKCLRNIDLNIPALGDPKNVQQAATVIIDDCQTIQSCLAQRMELKRK